jgi:hypothetical protein
MPYATQVSGLFSSAERGKYLGSLQTMSTLPSQCITSASSTLLHDDVTVYPTYEPSQTSGATSPGDFQNVAVPNKHCHFYTALSHVSSLWRALDTRQTRTRPGLQHGYQCLWDTWNLMGWHSLTQCLFGEEKLRQRTGAQ